MALGLACGPRASADMVTITVENMAPEGGTWLTPVFYGFHDNSFDLFDLGSSASTGLEIVAESGNPATLIDEFNTATSGSGVGGAITGLPGPIFAPNTGAFYATVDVEPSNRFLSFASMVIPSNDAFVGNDEPIAVFDSSGNLIPMHILVLGLQVLDAGTEANTEAFDDAAGSGGYTDMFSPAEDVDTNIHNHPGFLPAGSGTILDNPNVDFSNADFENLFNGEYPVLRIQIIPEPGLAGLLGVGGLIVFGRRPKVRRIFS